MNPIKNNKLKKFAFIPIALLTIALLFAAFQPTPVLANSSPELGMIAESLQEIAEEVEHIAEDMEEIHEDMHKVAFSLRLISFATIGILVVQVLDFLVKTFKKS